MAATIELSATEVVIDEVVTIAVRGLQPDHAVTVRLSTAMADRWCSSHASFVPGVDGSVDLSVLAPVTGTYNGVDPMGLFWSVGPDRRPPPGADERGSVIVVAEVDGREVARAGLTRRGARREVQVLAVRERGLIGELFWEPDQPPRPAVVVVGGSEGGLSGWGRSIAAGLASDGYTALSLAYFGIEGLPRHLSLIPIEYFECALDWLGEHASVDSARLGVLGGSRGGELALLLGATFQSVGAVVAYSPSHLIWSEISFGFHRRRSSWTHRGRPLPFVDIQLPMSAVVAAHVTDSQPAAVIPVERIDGGVLLVTGEADTLWPSTLMADHVMKRLQDHAHTHPYEHARYPKAGHAINRPFIPTRGLPHGGTPEGRARANECSWNRVRTFLKSTLGGH